MSDKTVTLSEERITYLEGLVRQARAAAAVFSQFTQEDVDRIVKPMVISGLEQAQYLARLAVEETKIGLMEDKAIKNMVATEFVYNYVKDKRTVGVIREDPGAQPGRSGRTHRSHLFPAAHHQPDVHGAVQVHHGDQDAEYGDLQPASQRVEVLLRSGADHE